MKLTFRLFRRKNKVFYCEDLSNGKQLSLHTKDKAEAQRLLAARNEAAAQDQNFNLRMAEVYLASSDPKYATRTWQEAFEAILPVKKGATHSRWGTAIKDKAFDLIRSKVIIQTQGQDLLDVLKAGTVSTNVYLRRVYNFALDLGWLPRAILPKRQWPKIHFKSKRAITAQEHQLIIDREPNPERRFYYQMAWELGASQSDLAALVAEKIDRQARTIIFERQKLDEQDSRGQDIPVCQVHYEAGSQIEKLLEQLPQSGFLFPYLASVRANDRATEFWQRCQGLGILGVSLHSYRYAWAQRAKKAGYPERFAQAWLGQNSKAVHEYYAKGAQMAFPSLEAWQKHFAGSEILHIDFQKPSAQKPASEGQEVSPIGDKQTGTPQ